MDKNLLLNVPEAINKILENYKIVVVPKDSQPVQLNHGHWIKEINPMMYQLNPYVWVCDQCGTAFQYKTPYCGECGCVMDEVEDV